MMAAPNEVGQLNLDTPRSPVSISTDSSRRGSLKQAPEKLSDPPTPNSPRTRFLRKRAASLNTDSANEPRIGDLALNSANTTGRPPTLNSLREQVCLCQPDPKIPRPRNAFILYRQHYQAQVVAQHPGLANPEISKIIGEQWREQAPEVKSDWKRLAEEEKQRHQRQYPGYRYQPRRAGKSNGLRPAASSSSTDDPVRCPKCNGRYISTPNTPLTPFTSALGSGLRNERLLPLLSSSRPSEVERTRYPNQMQNVRVDTPRIPLSHQHAYLQSQYPPPQPLQTHRERDDDMDLLSPSPGQKRRRFNDENQRGYAVSSPSPFQVPHQFIRNGAPPPMSTGGYRQHLPGPSMIVRTGTMGTSSQHSPMSQQPRNPYPNRSSEFDESLRLPPLQTKALSSTTASLKRVDTRMEAREIQARSVEAMVMTIPYLNKIKVLTKISPPLPPPGPLSPAQEIRGAVIAVEGADKALLGEVGDFINDYLTHDPSCAIKTWATVASSAKKTASPVTDTEMMDTTPPTPAGLAESEDKDPFVEYLSIISEWHKKSMEIIKYITTPVAIPAESTASSAVKTKVLPIALVPEGFSLTVSDIFALRIPINDSYAPVDHWQWMATLWRGIVGPDLTIYINSVGRDETNKSGGVEIRADCAAIIVKVPEGSKMDEKIARRLGFEVVEFVRNLESGFGRS